MRKWLVENARENGNEGLGAGGRRTRQGGDAGSATSTQRQRQSPIRKTTRAPRTGSNRVFRPSREESILAASSNENRPEAIERGEHVHSGRSCSLRDSSARRRSPL